MLPYLDNPTIDNSSLLLSSPLVGLLQPEKEFFFPRKEVIQPHLPIRLPCYDFTPVIGPTFGSSLLAVGSLTSGVTDSHGVTGGVYKTRERIPELRRYFWDLLHLAVSLPFVYAIVARV